jgi:hypothetical protein
MNEDTIRAWWAQRQGLDGSLMGASAQQVLTQAGWSRSVGGAGPYFTVFSRAGLSRQAIDEAVAALEIHELPAARGCTYVVPASDFGLALRVGQGFGDEAQIATAKKYLGVTDAELDRLCATVLDALDEDTLDPRELKEAVGDAVRNLGPEGKKRGVTTTLPLALGRLQTQGAIRRAPVNGRLDQQRYRYTRWRDQPGDALQLSAEEAYSELARRFFRWIGPATVANFQWFSGLGARAARAAAASLALAPLAEGDDRLIFPEDREALLAFQPPPEPHFVLTSSLDNITHLRRDVVGLLAASDLERRVFDEQGETLISGLADLPSHPILDRGQLVGLWEYDPAAQKIVWAAFRPQPQALLAEIERTEAFVRDQLGDMRSFSLDSPQSRQPRLAALRKVRG